MVNPGHCPKKVVAQINNAEMMKYVKGEKKKEKGKINKRPLRPPLSQASWLKVITVTCCYETG